MHYLVIAAATLVLVGCAGQRGPSNYQPYYVQPMPAPYQMPTYQMPVQQQQYQKPVFCNSNRVGGTVYTNCH